MQEQIRDLIRFPESEWPTDLEGEVEVSMTVDRQNRVHVVLVEGENFFLVDHVDRLLDEKVIEVDSKWVGKVFSTTIEFKKLS